MAKKLMIVDDHAVARRLVRHASATPQDTVLECGSLAEALKAVASFGPDCVLMGVSCPVPGALQAIKAIRETHPDIRVVAVSGSHEAELRHAASEAAAAGFVTTENLSELFLLAAPERLNLQPARRSGSRRRRK